MLLGDGLICRSSPSTNARVEFYHGIAQSALIYHLYDLFADFIDSPPKINTRKLRGKNIRVSECLSWHILALIFIMTYSMLKHQMAKTQKLFLVS